MTAPNDEIKNGEEDGSFWLMCKKCGDSYKVSERDYKMYRDVRWRCRPCVYMWL